MTENSKDKRYSCGIWGAMFGRRSVWGRKTSSTGFITPNDGSDVVKASNNTNSKRRRGGSNEAFLVDCPSSSSSNATNSKAGSAIKPATNSYSATPNSFQDQSRKVQEETTKTGTSKMGTSQGYVNRGKRVPKEAIGLSGELESMISDHQKSKGSIALVRASSGNVMLHGNLGNLRQPAGRGNIVNSYNVTSQTPKVIEESQVGNGGYTNQVVKTTNNRSKEEKSKQEQSGSLCRIVSTRTDPEQLKILGNEDYKNGRFTEALSLYDAAISIDPNKASYRSNKSAALTALGRILEAVFECREAIRIEPNYLRAHQRLGSLYLRLGETDKAQYHLKRAGGEADPDEIAKVKILQAHLNKCTEARRLRDWNTLIKETNGAISAAADSAPQLFALQAEALLKLRRHQDADKAISRGPHFDDDQCIKFFGPICYASVLVTRSQVDMVVGRIDEALEAAQLAAKLDRNNREANMVLQRFQEVAVARTNGNQLFKASKFSEACAVYAKGLEHDPCNSVLLCNRAACLSKLGQYQKAVEDCNLVLNLRPSYSKARLRRADCNAKLQRWEASIQDYEILLRETPEDEELKQASSEAQEQLKKLRG